MKTFLQILNKDIITYILQFIYNDKIKYKDKYFKFLFLHNSFIQLYHKIPKLKKYILRNQYIHIDYIQYKYIYRKDQDKNNIDFRLIGYHEYLLIQYRNSYIIDIFNNIITYINKKNIYMYNKNNKNTATDVYTYVNIYKKNEKNNIFILDKKKEIFDEFDNVDRY